MAVLKSPLLLIYKKDNSISKNHCKRDDHTYIKMWKRPENSEYPATYSKFEGRKEIDGKKRQYWVQDLTEEYFDDVLKHLVGYVTSELMCTSIKISEQADSMKDLEDAWKVTLNQKIGLLCLTKNEKGENEIAGFNITGPKVKDHDSIQKVLKSKGSKMVIDACKFVAERTDVFKAIGSDVFLYALGLYVVPKFRGNGLAVEILKARKGLCENVGLKGTATVFSSIISQKAAYKAGFTDLASVTYEEMEKTDPSLRFPGVSDFTKDLKYMYIKY